MVRSKITPIIARTQNFFSSFLLKKYIKNKNFGNKFCLKNTQKSEKKAGVKSDSLFVGVLRQTGRRDLRWVSPSLDESSWVISWCPFSHVFFLFHSILEGKNNRKRGWNLVYKQQRLHATSFIIKLMLNNGNYTPHFLTILSLKSDKISESLKCVFFETIKY